MTVSSSTNKVSFNGDGSTTVFAYSFKVFDESDLTVILRASDGTETTQTITTNYTVSGVGDAGGGNVTMVTAPASGEQLTILREQPLTQGLDLVPNDPFPANSIEDSLDKLTFMVQQQQEELDRSIKASKTTTISTVEFVESAATRANKVFAFDGSGDLDLTQEIGTFQGDWAASTAYAVRDIVKDTNNNNIYIANTAHTSSGTVPLTGNADIAKWDLLVDAAAATTSANNAATSATAAATSATAAATSATAAATSESNAATSASNASTSETNAAASATNAATSESNAAGSESAAATSETNAATSATNASTSASAAATSATNAATSETAAAASQAAAATSETNAATSATSAATNATNAATSASNASTAQTAAETAQTAAEAAQAAAELAADNFDDTYLGSKSSDPTVDNDGGALNAGDLYFNTTSNTLKVYSGSAWQDAAVDSSGFVQTTGDTMTGNLDIQGTLTSDGLTVDGTIQTGLNEPIDVRDGVGDVSLRLQSISSGANAAAITIDPDNTGGSSALEIQMDGTTKVAKFFSGGDISFYEDTGTTAKFFWDASAESLGIGGASPAGTAFAVTNAGAEGLEIRPTGGLLGGTSITAYNRSGSAYIPQTYNASQHIFVNSGSSNEKMRIDSSGKLGINNSSPSYMIDVTAQSSVVPARLSAASGDAQMYLQYNTSTTGQFIGCNSSGTFQVQRGSDGTTMMAVDTSGNMLVGMSSTSGLGTTNSGNYFAGNGNSNIVAVLGTGNNKVFQWYNANGEVGSISTLGSSTSYNTSSDYRLKENVTDVTDGITRVKQLAPKRFNFIADPDTTVDGFIAHEVQDVIPEAISGAKDAMRDEEYEVTPAVLDDDGNVVTEAVMGTRSVPDYQGIDQSKLVPLLTAALQEAIAKIETLETKVAALEGA